MPTVNVTIPTPVIVAPAVFKVRYMDTATPGVWVTLPDQTNALFSFVVPAFGSYILGVTYVSPDALDCKEALYPFDVFDPCPCIVITTAVVLQQSAGAQPTLVIAYNNPSSNPVPCGVRIHYKELSLPGITPTRFVHLNPMPASPIVIPVKVMGPVDVSLILDCCDGNAQNCFTGTATVQPSPIVTCIGISALNHSVDIVRSSSTGTYYLRLTFPGLPSTPSLCPEMGVSGNQIKVMQGAAADNVSVKVPPASFYRFGATGWQTMVALNPSPNYTFEGIQYTVTLLDCCGAITYYPAIPFTGVQIA